MSKGPWKDKNQYKYRGKEQEDIPPLMLWRPSGKADPGPNELQKRYFINKMPPSKRPHWHCQDVLVSVGGVGSGKSWKAGTGVLFYDGTTVNIEDVKVGDLLMGPDSTPREVLALGRGRETFYKVTPVKGEPFYCNKSHILSLKATNQGLQKRERVDGSFYIKPPRYGGQEVINVSIKEYLGWTKRKQRAYLLYRAECVIFKKGEKPLDIDPYFLGLWLGDGDSDKLTITTIDKEVEEATVEFANNYGNSFRVEKKAGKNGWIKRIYIHDSISLLKQLNLYKNKHIPHQYKTASVEERKALLAGLIDSDGYCGSNVIEITQKIKVLVEDIAFVARSLGLAAYIKEVQKSCLYKGEKKTGTYYKISISGDMSDLPVKLERKKCSPRKQKKSVLMTGFTLEKLPEDDYYGVVLDGDHLFLLGDFTVVHNSLGEVNLLLDTCINVPGTKALIGGIDLQLLKRNVVGMIRAACTINKAWDHPAIVSVLSDKQTSLRFENGSELTLVNLTDFLKVIGVTVGMLGVEEPHLLPDGEESFQTLLTRIRDSKPEVRQIVLCTNPEKSKEGWMNRTFEMHKFDGVDTSRGPVEIKVGKPCECQICLRCKISYNKDIPWVRGDLTPEKTAIIPNETSECVYCPECLRPKDYWTWKGKRYYCPGNEQFIRVIKSESMHNPHIPDDVLQSMRNQYDEATFDIMVRGALNRNLRDDDYLYPTYLSELCEIEEEIPVDYSKDIYVSMDWNLKPLCGVICQFEEIGEDEVFLTKEEIVLYGPGPYTEASPYGSGGARPIEAAREFVRRHKVGYQGTDVFVYGDPKGYGGVTEREENSFEIFCNFLEKEDFNVHLMMENVQYSVPDRITLMNHHIEEGLLKFNPEHTLQWTCKSMLECKWKTNNKGRKEVDKSQDENAARSLNKKRIYAVTHLNEALGYMVLKLFPVIEGALRSAVLGDGTVISEERGGKTTVRRPNKEDEPPKEFEDHQSWIESKDAEMLDRIENPGKYGGLNFILGGALPKRKLTRPGI